MIETTDTTVLVVGAGPVGLSTAYFLTRHGARPWVVERRPGTGDRPRAGTSPRTMELFRAAGVGDELEAIGWEPPDPYRTVIKESGVGATLGSAAMPEPFRERLLTGTPVPRRMVWSDQIERVLLERVRAAGGRVSFGTRVTGVRSGPDAVTVTVVDDRGERTLTAGHVVAADGARSRVRESLGIGMPDREVVGTLTTAQYRARVDGRYPDDARFCFVRNDHVHAALGARGRDGEWVGHIMDHPGKKPRERLSDDRVVALLRAAIGDPQVEIELQVVDPWEATLGVASTFRAGRVFLAGDAAHVQTSAGGLGMNTGIQDGHNLAWKLAAVLRGEASPGLLDTYEQERIPVATLSVEFSRAASRSVGIGSDGPRSDELLGYAGVRDHLRAMMFYGYRSAAVVGAAADEPDVLHDAVRAGYRFPHVPVLLDGRPASTVELPGPEWILLAGPGAPASGPLPGVRVHRVGPPSDPTGRLVALLGTDGAALVRPDGFVAWCGRGAAAADGPGAALRRILHPASPVSDAM